MSNNPADPNFDSTPPAARPNSLLVLIVGLIGGIALVVVIAAWYFRDVVNKPAPPLPGTPAHGNQDAIAPELDTPAIIIEPLAEMHVKIVHGVAESIDQPKNSGITAKLKGQDIAVSADKDVKEGDYEIEVRGAKNKSTMLKVTVKKK